MLLIPFSSVLAVLSEGPAKTHAASHRADSDVESHILALGRSLNLPCWKEWITLLAITSLNSEGTIETREKKKEREG